MTNGSHSVNNASKIRSQKKAAPQCSHVQALMCLSRLSAVQCFLHSLHCTSRVTSGNHSLPHGWNLQSRHYVASKHHPKTLYFCIFPGNLGSSKITSRFWRLPLRALLLMALQGRFHSLMAWSQMAINVLGGCKLTFPPKRKRIQDSQIQKNTPTPLDQPTLYDLVLSFFKTL